MSRPGPSVSRIADPLAHRPAGPRSRTEYGDHRQTLIRHAFSPHFSSHPTESRSSHLSDTPHIPPGPLHENLPGGPTSWGLRGTDSSATAFGPAPDTRRRPKRSRPPSSELTPDLSRPAPPDLHGRADSDHNPYPFQHDTSGYGYPTGPQELPGYSYVQGHGYIINPESHSSLSGPSYEQPGYPPDTRSTYPSPGAFPGDQYRFATRRDTTAAHTPPTDHPRHTEYPLPPTGPASRDLFTHLPHDPASDMPSTTPGYSISREEAVLSKRMHRLSTEDPSSRPSRRPRVETTPSVEGTGLPGQATGDLPRPADSPGDIHRQETRGAYRYSQPHARSDQPTPGASQGPQPPLNYFEGNTPPRTDHGGHFMDRSDTTILESLGLSREGFQSLLLQSPDPHHDHASSGYDRTSRSTGGDHTHPSSQHDLFFQTHTSPAGFPGDIHTQATGDYPRPAEPGHQSMDLSHHPSASGEMPEKIRYSEIRQNPTRFLQYTGLTPLQFDMIVEPFDQKFQQQRQQELLQRQQEKQARGQKTRKTEKVRSDALLQTPRDRLFFILVHINKGDTYKVQAARFGMGQPKVKDYVHSLLSPLQKTAKDLQISPHQRELGQLLDRLIIKPTEKRRGGIPAKT